MSVSKRSSAPFDFQTWSPFNSDVKASVVALPMSYPDLLCRPFFLLLDCLHFQSTFRSLTSAIHRTCPHLINWHLFIVCVTVSSVPVTFLVVSLLSRGFLAHLKASIISAASSLLLSDSFSRQASALYIVILFNVVSHIFNFICFDMFFFISLTDLNY